MKTTQNLILYMLLCFAALAATAADQLPFVTINSTEAPVTASSLAKAASWKSVEKTAVGHALAGSVVLRNDRLVLAARAGAESAELFSQVSGVWKSRAHLAPLNMTGATIANIRFRACGEDLASLEIEFARAGKTASIQFDLRPAQLFVKTTALTKADGLQVRAASRYGMVPDFYGDDMTMDAGIVPVDRIAFPTDDVFLQPGVGGDALLGYFWSGNQEIECTLNGQADGRQFASTCIRYSGDKPFIAVAILDSAQPCYVGQYETLSKAEYTYQYEKWNSQTKKLEKTTATVPVVDLKWSMPYFAQWRVNFLVRKDTAKNGLRTRQMLIPEGNGQWRFAKLEQGLDGKQNEQVVVRALPGQYPAWFQDDAAKAGRVSPLEENYAVIIYPYDRGRETPLDAVTFMDLFREIIGKGPCEYILTAQANVDEGLAACPATYTIASYEGRITQKRVEVEALLQRTEKFFHACHNRLEKYKQCRDQTLSLLKAYDERHSAVAVAKKFQPILDKIPEPTKPIQELEAEWNPVFAAFRATLDSDGPEAKQKRKELGEKIRQFGTKQEGALMSGARKYLKQLRTQAGVESALNPEFKETAAKIRALVTESLKGPIAHEMMNKDLR